MKTIKSIMLAMVLLVATTLSASNGLVDKKKPTTVTEEIGYLLENPSFEIKKEINTTAVVMFNEDGELVVLSVDTDNQRIERFVKSRLNYQKLSNKLDEGKKYKVPIRLISGK
ncbi:hypothetical protein POV27_05035 [Aureisphaera galaxeae]|uniref:hypothetical protein n=1 Tax=Aureisphaera galaxeae TaxID=1538023 RepID=UPI0023507260|nr:hypothetical protein [Aureisphaera galaxeae]MDC8003403.1 hypothetical protein [Aureisphaera galaxeae]